MAKKLPEFSIIVTFKDGTTNKRKCTGTREAKAEYRRAFGVAARFAFSFVTCEDEKGERVDLF